MDGACGNNSVATKRNLVEILRFRHFSRHVVFDAEGDKFRNKRIEDYITVSVVIDMECWKPLHLEADAALSHSQWRAFENARQKVFPK